VLEHSIRSARLVRRWLEQQGAAPELITDVERLILHHELGGDREADLLQAADSLSFLEVNAPRVQSWIDEGRCDVAEFQAKLDWMRDRIRVAAARSAAQALHAQATAALGA